MLLTDGPGGEPRYRMLETIREFGLERLTATEKLNVLQRAHTEYYARLAVRAEPELTGADQLAWFGRLETEHANLRAALAIGTGDYTGAERCLAESLALARVADDRYWMGFALGALGVVALHHGDLARASALAEEGLTHVRAVGDDDAMAALLGNLGNVAFFRGDHARAVARAEESLALYRALGSVHGAASVLSTLGRALLELGDHERALAVLDEGLVLSQQIGNKWYTITALLGLAAAATVRREWERAARLFGAVEALTEASGIAMRLADRASNERLLATVRAHLDEATFAAARAAGAALPLETAIADASTQAIEEAPAPAASDSPLAARATDGDVDKVTEIKRPIFPGLTPREGEVLALLAEGQSDSDIAAALSISERTAGNHVQHIIHKLGVKSRTAAAIWAFRNRE